MKLATYVGSLVEAGVGAHAILNAANPAAALGSGVSGAIREACGGLASAGSCTAFRWVLHVAAVDYRKPDAETGGPSGPRRVRGCMRAALAEATSLAAASGLAGHFVLATPLLGAGHGGLGPIVSLEAMLGALKEHLREATPVQRDVLAKLVFVVLKPEDARLVEHAAARYSLAVER